MDISINNSSNAIKQELRIKYRLLRKGISRKEELDRKITKNFLSFLHSTKEGCQTIIDSNSNSKIIAGYIAVDGEADPAEILQYYYQQDSIISLPKILNGQIVFTRWDLTENLVFNHFYQTKSNEIIPSDTIDIIIIPLIAFNHSCYRLGFGGGFYDKAIKNIRELSTLSSLKTKFIGLGYGQQYCPSFIPEKHDQRLDYIITDQQVYS